MQQSRRMMSTCSYPESDEELSEASMDDVQAVVNMCGDVYHGIDYLPSTFHHLVHGPGVKAFVYKVKGELVAFTSTQLQAGGQYLLFLASRVKVAWQGHGIYSRFRRKIFEHFSDKELYPGLRHETVTVTAGNSHAKGGRMRNAGWHLVLTRYSRMQGFEASNLHQLRLKKPTHEVTAMTRDEFLQLLQACPGHWLHLFPQKRIIHSWKSYVVTEDNLDLILGQSFKAKVYVTKSMTASHGTKNVTSSHVTRNVTSSHVTRNMTSSHVEVSMLSLGTYYPCEQGISYTANLYGTGRQQEIEDHINVHLQRLKDLPGESLTRRVVFTVFHSEKIDESVAADVYDRLEAYNVDEPAKLFVELDLWERNITELQTSF